MASYRYERDIDPKDLVQEKPRELTPAEARANWWHYHWYYVALVLVALLAAGYFFWQKTTTVEPDYTVTVVGRAQPEQSFLDAIEAELTPLAEDVNGDGKIKIEVKPVWLDLRISDNDADLRQLMESSQEKLNADFYLCQSMIFIVDDPAALEQVYACFRLLDGTDPQEGDTVRIEDFAVPLEDTALASAAPADETQWYLARRTSEGVNDKALAIGDELWGKLN